MGIVKVVVVLEIVVVQVVVGEIGPHYFGQPFYYFLNLLFTTFFFKSHGLLGVDILM